MLSWNDNFRRTPRSFSFREEEGILEVICQDTIYCNYTLGENNEILSIDPDGGPYLEVNKKLYCDNIVIVIDDILDYKHINSSREESLYEDEEDIYDLYIKMRAHKL